MTSLSVLRRASSNDDSRDTRGFLGMEKFDGALVSRVSDLDFMRAWAGRGISGTSGISSSSSSGSSLNLGNLGSSLPGM